MFPTTFNNNALIELEKIALAVLMHEPTLRHELIRKYPGRVFNLFPDADAQRILRSIFNTNEVAIPAFILRENSDLFDSEDWNPQIIYDSISFEYGTEFWSYIEKLRQVTKQREVHETLTKSIVRLMHADLEKIDTVSNEISEKINQAASNVLDLYDPNIVSAAQAFEQDRAAGITSVRVSSGIRVLDEGLDGGFQKSPGELVIFSGFEKQRKTTTIMNVLLNMYKSGLTEPTVWVCNEGSVSRIQALGDLWAMEATRLARQRNVGYITNGVYTVASFSRYEVLTREYTGTMNDVVQEAYEFIKALPIRMYFAGHKDGNSRDFFGVMARVASDIEFHGATQVIIDNFQGWKDSSETDYEVMNRVVPPIDDLAARYGALVLAVSQYSREGKIRGGNDASSRANLVIGTEYDPSMPTTLTLESKFARNRGYFKINVDLIPSCGLII